MATSRFPTTHYTSSQFVESVGAVLFNLRRRAVCLVHLPDRDEWVLAKGRRACGESRQQTALREVNEETGYPCRLLPLTMATRLTPKIETECTPDIPRTFTNVSEPIAVTVRVLGEQDAKLIWWYVAAIDEEALNERLGKEKLDVALFSYEEVVERLTFQVDRDTVKMAINLVKETYDRDNSSG
jgi:8-oxo-dGTP pyrophosphatase MutT (NUDIX family)